MRYVIVGAGAIGASVAAEFQRQQIPVVLIARGAHGAAIRADGLRYHRPDAEHRVHVPVVGSAAELALTDDDVLVVATKSQDTEAVLQEWAWQPLPDGSAAATSLPLISLQNGIENERTALRRFARTSGAAVWMPASYLNPGEVVAPAVGAVGVFLLGRYPGGQDRDAPRWAADLTAGGFEVHLVDDLRRWKATKLLANLRNAIDALFGGGPRTDELAEVARDEGRRALTAAGVPFADVGDAPFDRGAIRLAPNLLDRYAGSSTRQSLTRATGSVEADFLNGEIVLLGRLHDVDTPVNAALQRLIAAAARERVAAGGADPSALDAVLRMAS